MQQREGFTQAEKVMMMLSKETLEGLKITGIYIHVHCIDINLWIGNFCLLNSTYTMFYLFIVKSFVETTRYLLSEPGVKFVLSERFSQDPLESFFGNQWARGGRNDNPTVQQFIDNTVSLRVQGSAALDPVRGNCGKRPLERAVDEEPLPKRPRRK